jgi:gliding motility-associated-like protein
MRSCFIGLLILLFSAQFAFAQKESNIWYFGNNAGLDFSTGTVRAISNGKLNTTEGCASIADKEGRLLFYTDGITVWNGAHKIMANGTDLMGDPSSTQSGIIVPRPGNHTQYYVFTVDNVAQPNGFRYSTVDLAQEEGLGKVTHKNELLLTPVTEKLTAVAHENGKDIWVIVHGWNNNAFYAYLVTEAGIAQEPVISRVGTVHNGRDNNTIGYLKASPSGSKLALAIRGMKLYELFDFDDATGIISNPVVFQSNNYNSAYGLEFSPDGSKLYINASFTPTAKIYQIDLNSKAVTLIGTSASSYAGAMQLGPDGKIYFSRYESQYLGVIHHPNEAGIKCGYIDNGLYLEGKTAAFGLPNFVQSWFYEPSFTFSNVCLSEPTFFAIADTANIRKVHWIFDDPVMGVINMSGLKNPVHVFSQAGEYTISLSITYKNGSIKKTSGKVKIQQMPTVSLGKDTILCTGQSLILQATFPGATYAWQDGSTESTYKVSKSGIYWVDVSTGGCPARDSITVVYQAPLSVELAQEKDTMLCAGSSLLLTVKQPVAGTSYKWQDGSAKETYLVKKPGIYWVEASNACGKSRDSIRIDYTESLTSFSLGNDAVLRPEETLLLQVNIPHVNYLWQDGSTEPSLLVKQAGTYWVEISNSCEKKRDSIRIEFALPVKTEVVTDTAICQGSVLQLKASVLASSHAYQWQDGSTDATFTVNKPGTYWVETNSKSRVLKNIFRVSYRQTPQVELGENTTLCGDGLLMLNARQTDRAATYVWQDGSTEATFNVQKPGKYWVEVTNSCGTVRDSITIECLECRLEEMPNVITPNNDGANDSFSFKCMSENVWQIEIYNRWGKVVFASKHYQGEWDATNLDNGIYYYTLKSNTSDTPYKGVIHVLR